MFGQTIYDFSTMRIGFEVFRYEGDYVVEHWDNIQPREGIMVGGTTDLCDLELTEDNRKLVKCFIEKIFINKQSEKISEFVNLDSFVEHSTLLNLLEKFKTMDYKQTHHILAEGNFILAATEGYNCDAHTSFYDLFRIEDKKIVEHWDTTEKIPPPDTWKNNNRKF